MFSFKKIRLCNYILLTYVNNSTCLYCFKPCPNLIQTVFWLVLDTHTILVSANKNQHNSLRCATLLTPLFPQMKWRIQNQRSGIGMRPCRSPKCWRERISICTIFSKMIKFKAYFYLGRILHKSSSLVFQPDFISKVQWSSRERYNMKCRGKWDNTWNIPRSITFSPLHFMFYRGKSITFGTVYRWTN